MFGAIGGAIQRAISRVAKAAVFAAPRHHQVQRAARIPRQSPGKGLGTLDAVVLEYPGCSAVGGLEHAAAESGHIQNTRRLGALRIQQDVRGGRLRKRGAGLTPGTAATHILLDPESPKTARVLY